MLGQFFADGELQPSLVYLIGLKLLFAFQNPLFGHPVFGHFESLISFRSHRNQILHSNIFH